MNRASLAALAIAFTACSKANDATEKNPRGGESDAVHFRDVTRATGIDFVHHDGVSASPILLETMGGGVAVIDYDGDGRQDLYFVDSGDDPAQGDAQKPGSSRLYRNLGGLRFEDVSARAGVAGRGYGMGAVAGDYDSDGDQDLYVTNYGSNILFSNNGDGTFSDVTRAAGCDDARWSTGAAFLDFDRDGKLDLFVQNYLDYHVDPRHAATPEVQPAYESPEMFEPIANSLFRNRGDGTFEDVSVSSGIAEHLGKGLGVLVADFDGDGDADVYCANDTAANFLFENRGDGTLREVGLIAGAAFSSEGRSQSGMGVDTADIDGDGALDIVVTNFQDENNSIYRGEGALLFTEISGLTGTAEAARATLGFGVRFFDYDNDGKQDLVVANGHVSEAAAQRTPGATRAQPQHLFRGLGAARFEQVDARVAPEFATARVARGLCAADLDDDGDLDLVFCNLGAGPSIYENVGGDHNAWISARAIGTKRDSTAIGARVTVECGGVKQFNDVRSGASYLSQSDLRLFFGLGSAKVIERISVRWPDGSVEEARDVPVRRQVEFIEGRGMQGR